MSRFLVEFGTGIDLHGGDVTKAVKKAVKDAMSHCCMCGISEILHITDMNKVLVRIKIGCPFPEKLKRDEILKAIPVGRGIIEEVVSGGLLTKGLHVDELGEGDQVIVAVVSLSVCIEDC